MHESKRATKKEKKKKISCLLPAEELKTKYRQGDFVFAQPSEDEQRFKIFLLKTDANENLGGVKAIELNRALNEEFFILPSESKEAEAEIDTINIIGPARMQATECEKCFKLPKKIKELLEAALKNEKGKADLIGDPEDRLYCMEIIKEQRKKAKLPKSMKKMLDKERHQNISENGQESNDKDNKKNEKIEDSSEDISENGESSDKEISNDNIKRKPSPKKSKNEDRNDKPKKISKKEAMITLFPKPHLHEVVDITWDAPDCKKPPIKFPYDKSSQMMTNREAIYHAIKGNLSGINQMIQNSNKYSTFFQRFSADINKNAISYAIQYHHDDILKILTNELINEIKGYSFLNRAPAPKLVLKNSIENKRKLCQVQSIKQSTKSGKGNKLLNADSDLPRKPKNIYSFWDLEMTPELTELLLFKTELVPIKKAIEKLPKVIRMGDHQNAYKLLKHTAEHQIEDCCKLFYQCLEKKGEPAKVLKFSVVKRAKNSGIMPLHVACINPNPKPLKKLLSIMPEYNATDRSGNKLVHYAAACKSDATLKYLASKKNIDLNCTNSEHMTPMMIACKYGRVDNVKLLLDIQKKLLKENVLDEEEVDEETEVRSADFLNSLNKENQTPLYLACRSGSIECVEILLNAGANANIKTTCLDTPLMCASEMGHVEIIKLLIEKGKSDLLARDKDGKNALIYAVINGQIQIASILIRLGVSFNLTDSSGNTPLHYAAAYGWPNLVKYLIEIGADPNAMNSWNYPPASIAMLKQQFEIANYLLQLPNINTKFTDSKGRSLPMQLLMNFHSDILSQLKFLGENTNIDFGTYDKSGMSVFHYLAETKAEFDEAHFENDDENDENEQEMLEEEHKNSENKLIENTGENKGELEQEEKNEENPEENEENLEENKENPKENVENNEESIENCIKSEEEQKKEESAQTEGKKEVNINDDLRPTTLIKHQKEDKRSNHDCESDEDLQSKNEENIKKRNMEIEKITKNHNKLVISCAEYFKSKASININAKGELGATAFILALKNSNTDFALWLLNNGSTIEGMSPLKMNAFMYIIEYIDDDAYFNILKVLMSNAKSNTAIYKKVAEEIINGRTAIHELMTILMSDNEKARENGIILFKFIVEVSDFLTSKYGKPKHVHDSKGFCNILHLLCSLDKTTNGERFKKVFEIIPSESVQKMDTYSINGFTPLQTAILLNQESNSLQLINGNHNVNALIRDERKISCLHLAVMITESIKIVEALINKGANIESKDRFGKTPLHYAVETKKLAIVQALLKHGANANAKTDDGETVLHIAALNYQGGTIDTTDYADLLLKNKASLSEKNNIGQSALMYCFRSKIPSFDPIALVSLFLSHLSADQVNEQDNNKSTALHYACRKGAIISTMALIKHGGNLEIKNSMNNTPIAECLIYKKPDLAVYLLNQCDIAQKVYTKIMVENKMNYVEVNKQKELESRFIIKKQSLFELALASKNESLIYLLLSRGFPITKAAKDAIKQGRISLARRLFENNKSSFSKYLTKKDKHNLHNILCFNLKAGACEEEEVTKFSNEIINENIDPYHKGVNGENSIHGVCGNQLLMLFKNLINEKINNDILQNIMNEKANLTIPGRYEKPYSSSLIAKLQYTPITFLIAQNPAAILDELASIPMSKLILIDSHAKQMKEKSINQFESILCYIMGLSICSNIQLDLKMSFVPAIELASFPNNHLIVDCFPNPNNPVKTTALIYATLQGNFVMVLSLLAYGADINESDEKGRTCLMYAVINHSTDIFALLFNKNKNFRHSQKIEINKRDNNGETAAMYCLHKVFDSSIPLRIDEIESLIAEGADIFAKDNAGNSFIDKIRAIPNKDFLIQKLKGLKMPHLLELIESKEGDSEKMIITSLNSSACYNYFADCKAYLESKMKARTSRKPKALGVKLLNEYIEVVKDTDTNLYFDVFLYKENYNKDCKSKIFSFRMQLYLESIRNIYILYATFDEVGCNLRNNNQGIFYKQLDDAKKEFHRVFKQKTGNEWKNAREFVVKPKKYSLGLLSGEPILMEEILKKNNFSAKYFFMNKLFKPINLDKSPKSILPIPIQEMLIRILNPDFLKDLNCDKTIKVAKSLILRFQDPKYLRLAWKALTEMGELAAKIDNYGNNHVECSISEKQQILPKLYKIFKIFHQLKFHKGIASNKINKDLLSIGYITMEMRRFFRLGSKETIFNLLMGAKYNLKSVHPADYVMKALNLYLELISEENSKSNEEYKFISRYINISSGEIKKRTMRKYGIQTIIKIKSEIQHDEENKKKGDIFSKLHNHILLWYRASSSDLLSILAQGLKVQPSGENYKSMNFFDPLFFSDNFENAFKNYRDNGSEKKEGDVMLLCEVALGNVFSISSSHRWKYSPPPNYHSVKFISKWGPNLFGMTTEGVYFPASDFIKYENIVYIENGVKYTSYDQYQNAINCNKKKGHSQLAFDVKAQKRRFEEDKDEDSDGEKEDNDDLVSQTGENELLEFEKKFLNPDFIIHGIPFNEVTKLDEQIGFMISNNNSEYLINKSEQIRVRYLVLLKKLEVDQSKSEEEVKDEKKEEIDDNDDADNSEGEL